MEHNQVLKGDCLDLLKEVPDAAADLIYLDPPFFTGKRHASRTRDGTRLFSFEDFWEDEKEYVEFIAQRLVECRRALKHTGSIFLHADHNNVHLAREALDYTFGGERFESEIIWTYKRWSNSKKGLLQSHQTILFYSRSADFKWIPQFGDYSPTTNIDQILQKRARDERGKAVYATGADGAVKFVEGKRGVPLSDVWELPFLNPKARERTGYPTQKPLLLLERILSLTTEPGDLVLDPFCGSGTTLVAAKLMGRQYIGFDSSHEAVELSRSRLERPVRSESLLMEKGADSYSNRDPWVEGHLTGFSYDRVQRNSGIDALLRDAVRGRLALVRVQRKGEPIDQAIAALKRAAAKKGDCSLIVIATETGLFQTSADEVLIILSPALQLTQLQREDWRRSSPQVIKSASA